MAHRAAVITCSDRAFADVYEDRSGPILREGLATLGFKVMGFEAMDALIVPDEVESIRAAVDTAVAAGARVVLTTGGTGVAPRDVTVEAVTPLVDQHLPGIAELVRAKGCENTPRAALSRAIAGVIRPPNGPPAFIYTAPGSRGGARDTLAVLEPLLMHLVEQLDGADHQVD